MSGGVSFDSSVKTNLIVCEALSQRGMSVSTRTEVHMVWVQWIELVRNTSGKRDKCCS